MAPNDGKPSDFERRTSLRRSVGLSVQGDEDEFALAALGISDGFRPEEPSASVTTTPPDSVASARRATSAHLVDSQALDVNPGPPVRHATPSPSVTASARPSSIAKTRRNDSFSLRHDGVMGPVNNMSVVSRQSSVSTENPFVVAAETEQPYDGPSGPSHPYQMYPQNVRAVRTASIATTSTAAPLSERPYNGPIGPSHPYGMYPQNIVGDAAGVSVNNAAQPALVGFPGMTDQYRRRVGPDGDGTDLIGPDGHTEELPPYTRYPEGGYAPKPVQVGQQPAAGATVQPVQRLYDGQPSSDGAVAGAIPPGAGGIGLATLNPEFNTSADDVGSPQSRYSAHSFASESSRDRINAAAEPASEKPTESKWKQRARKKLWGVIPYWAICLTLTAVVLMGIIVGAIIGSFLSGRKPHHPGPGNSPAVSATVTLTLDATPLQTKPATLRDLQTGNFALPIVIPSRQSATCFNNTLEANAWSCTIVFSQMMMSVFKVEGNPDTANYAMHLGCNSSLTLDNGTFSYGTQPPCFNQNFTMNLVNDIYEPNRGPAWFFQHAYDKTVILPQDSLTVADTVEAHVDTGVSIKRGSFPGGGFNPFGSDFKRKSMAQPGEKPWFCTWGGTLLEVFVYANQDSNAYRDYTASARSSSCLPTSTTFSSTLPAATSSTVTGYSSAQSSSSDHSAKTKRYHSGVTIAVSHTTTITNPPQTNTTDPGATSTYGQWIQTGLALPPPPYPRVVKVEERRMSGPPAQAPICQQWEILEGSGRRPARDSNGKEIIIQIVENEPVPTLVTVNAAAKTGNSSRRKRDTTKKVQMSRDEIMRRFEGVYYVDEKGYLSQRDTQLVGQDLSNCGCLWWSN